MVDLVSTIIPTFNSGEYIEETIESVFRQTYDNIEIIIVDDGSTDDTVTRAKNKLKISGKSWQVLSLGENRGPSAARNAGCTAASGSWLQFLDSDDLLMPDKIEIEMGVAAYQDGRTAVVYSPWGWGFFENGQMQWLGPTKRPFIAEKHPIMCLTGGRSLLGSSLVRRSALQEVGGFDEGLRFWECEEINVRLARVGSFLPAPCADPQYFWRLRPDEMYIGGPGARYNSTAVSLGWIREAVKAAGGQPLRDLGLSDDDRLLFLRDCTLWARLIFAQDRPAFREYLRQARILDQNVFPAYPRYISVLSHLLGYEAAETVAKLTRQPKVWLRSALYLLGLRKRNMIIELT
jgi:glycosyltransferase involved in cell wall biosynthesis